MSRHVQHSPSGTTGTANATSGGGQSLVRNQGGNSSWVANFERDHGLTLTPTGTPGVYSASDGSVVNAPGAENVTPPASAYGTLRTTSQSESGWLPDYPYAEFLTPYYVDPLAVAARVGEYNATQVGPAASEAEQITSRFNQFNMGTFFANREALLPGVGQSQQDSLALGQDLTNFNLPQGFVNLLRRESATSAFNRGGGTGEFSQNRFYSTLGTTGLNYALQGAELTDRLNARASATAANLMPDVEQQYATALGLRTITPATGIAAEQFNSNLDFSRDQLIASDSRFRAESEAGQSRDFFQARMRGIELAAQYGSASGSFSLGNILTVGGAIIGGLATGGNPAGIAAGAQIGGALGGSGGGNAQQVGEAIGSVWPESPTATDDTPASQTTTVPGSGAGGTPPVTGGAGVGGGPSQGTSTPASTSQPTTVLPTETSGAVSINEPITPADLDAVEAERTASEKAVDDIKSASQTETEWSPMNHGAGLSNPSGRNAGEILI